MNKIIKLTMISIAVSVSIFMLSTSLLSDEHKAPTDAPKQIEAEMEETFGTVPVMFKAYPEHMRASAWEWFKSTMSPDAAIPAKYSQLISLGVASQIPCNYCIYAHTTMVKMLGATEKEIQEAIANAANTRHWSTVLNGGGVDFEEFKTEWDGILAHLKKQSEVEEKLNHDKKDIRISIEKNIDDTGEEIVNVVATGSGSVTKEDIEKELEKLYAEKNIDISSGNVNIEINVEETK
ncbi:TPA: carboxymuconolactone decarboxylase family protein [Candidatus Poribacteria bacterium]|nr:carboxymuconolactone decarboxylase family protein [Candidatus Poribacteria bacterium]HIA70355.1 carboxymuconolactone decarboxylase family protein [Candidatus Poribacteria bacterium]HIO79055.1 carboxymuconolactone decarboxylase family protein [Candidatus Poribacteria bacterium]